MKHLNTEQRLTVENMHLITSDQMQVVETALALIVAAVIQHAYDALVVALRALEWTVNGIVGLLREITQGAEADLFEQAEPYVQDLFHIALERAAVSSALMTSAATEQLLEAFQEVAVADRTPVVAAVLGEIVAAVKATALHPVVGFGSAVMAAGLSGPRFIESAVVAAKIDDAFGYHDPPQAIAPGPRSLIIARGAATRTDNVVSVGIADRLGINRYVNIGVPDHVQCDTCWLASEQESPLTLDEWNTVTLPGRFRPVPWQPRVKVRRVKAQIVRTPQRHRHCRCRLSAYDLSDARGIKTTTDRYGAIERFLKSQYGTAHEKGVVTFR